MAARLAAVLPRFVVLVVVLLLATAAATFAAQRTIVAPPASKPPTTEAPKVLVVPDVRGQAHVFAKVVLEEAGFAWRVAGPVRGYAGNVVVRQRPEPGTRVHDTGQPMITLELAGEGAQPHYGRPENRSAYRGSRIRVYDRLSVPFASPDRPEGRL